MPAKKKAKKKIRKPVSNTKTHKSTKLARKKSAPSRAKTKPKKKASGPKKKAAKPRRARSRAEDVELRLPARSDIQSGDLQGVSDAEIADSESVEELLDEGNAFEAGVVSGIQRAEDESEQEVRTREFPEDDVPEEYLDED